MDQRSKGKGKQVEKPSTHSAGEGSERRPSFTEIRARESDRQKQIEQHGPDLLTGEGMDSKQFLERLKKREERSRFQKAWDHMPHGGTTSRETIVKEFAMQAQEYIQRIRRFAQKYPVEVQANTGHTRVNIEDYLRGIVKAIDTHVEQAIKNSNTEGRETACDMLAVDSDLLQRLEWRIKNAGNLENKGKINKETFDNACTALKASLVHEGPPPFDYRAFQILSEATRDEHFRIQKSLTSLRTDAKDEIRAYAILHNEGDGEVMLRNIEFRKNFFITSKLTSDQLREGVNTYIEDCSKVFQFGEEMHVKYSSSETSDSQRINPPTETSDSQRINPPTDPPIHELTERNKKLLDQQEKRGPNIDEWQRNLKLTPPEEPGSSDWQ
jgi:hypothetical protein